MKKYFILAVAMLGMAIMLVGCGKKEDNAFDGESIADGLNDCVYKVETMDGFEPSQDASYVVSNDRIYEMVYKYDYPEGEEGEIYPEPKAQDDEATVDESAADEEESDGTADESAVDEEESNETAVETEEAAVDEVMAEEADSDEDDAEAKKRAASSGIDISDAEIPVEDPGYVAGEEGKMSIDIKCYDYSGKEIYKITNEYPGNYSIYNFVAGNNGELYFVVGVYNYENGQDSYSLVCLGPDGKEKWQTGLDSKTSSDAYYYPTSVFLTDKSVILVSTVGIEEFTFDGKSSGLKQVKGFENIGLAFMLGDGSIAASFYGENDAEVYKVDVANGKIGEKIAIPFQMYNYGSFVAGTQHDLLMSDSSGLYYYDFGDEKPHKLMDYIASDLCISGISNVLQRDDNTIIGTYFDEFEGKNVLAIFNKVSPEEVANRKTISVGGLWLGMDLKKNVVDFNRANQEYRIVMVDYAQQYADMEWTELIKKVNNDIITGKLPDILVCDSSLNVDSYVANGVFAQLDSYIDNDPDISKSDYLDNVIEALSYDGKLYYVAPSFSIRTSIAKTSSVGDKTGWNMSEFIQFADSLPEGTSAYDLLSKDDFINNIMYYNGGEFIDRNTGKVSFDSQEFIDVLKFTDRLPKEIDYDKLDSENYWDSYDTILRDGRAMLQISSIYDLTEAYNNEITYFGAPVTYIGFPAATGTGHAIAFDTMVAINSKSKYKDAAWDFIKVSLLDEAQDKLSYTLPVKKSALEKKAAEAIKNYDKNASAWIAGVEIKMVPPTQADMDRIVSVISSADKVANYSEDVLNIVKEVVPAYYDGQKSAEEVAKTIQNRVQVYVNESR